MKTNPILPHVLYYNLEIDINRFDRVPFFSCEEREVIAVCSYCGESFEDYEIYLN